MFDLLKGVRVVDLSTVVLGPYATQLVADMGADVIKVETMAGDVFRAARPGRPGGDGAGFLNLNRNKRSIALDLTQAGDKRILDRLVASADVFVHNMRENAARKLGLDYGAIKVTKPDIVYCAARGFGRGLYGDEPAYDDCIQAASGLAWLNEDANGEPRFVRTVMCDKVAGLHLAFAIAAGLASRGRTGEGCHVETPMYEAMASFLLIEQLSGQSFVPPLPDRGYGRLNSPSRRPYRTRDGYVTIMPYTAAQWQRFLRLVGQEELASSPDVTDDQQRSRNIDRLYGLVADAAPDRTSAEWLETLRAADIPCAPVNRLEDLPVEPHLAGSGYFRTMTHPVEGGLMYTAPPFASDTARQTPDRPAPALDADRAAILAELGLS
ncbi:CaiB/BaiF CoA-transferase family protein [Niveispirillum sp.]|uniref:CaiB/BaiF CoA transferase family protein n=1 Tax=Niveispirillum sp. TaxID=1917217 RepID=UPI001B5F9046|nr:CoA transferase [Niveispirillum sp.]MBP7339595.1 CoA transferase [Niveispirillum sp.]